MAKALPVDDEAVVREFVRGSLEANGHVVMEGEDGVEVVEKFRSEKPDLVFLDVRMPRMGGVPALQRICKTDIEVKVVILTALDDVVLEREAGQAGAFDLLRKGIGFEAFMTVARRRLDGAARVERKVVEPGVVNLLKVEGFMASMRRFWRSSLQGCWEEGYA